jgi:FG-GAP-like repeat
MFNPVFTSLPVVRKLSYILLLVVAMLELLGNPSCTNSDVEIKLGPHDTFEGNVTVVAPPTQDTSYASGPNAFGALYRSADCSVAGIVANDGATFHVAGVTQGYQNTLHSLAGLTTKDDLWPDGCTDPDANNPGSIAAYAGQAPNKKYVVATIDNSNPNVIDIYQATAPVAQQQDAPVQTITIGPNIGPIVAADLNDDGNPDLIVGFFGSSSPKTNGGFAVLLSNGDGSFGAPTIIQTPNIGIYALSLVDVNHDGKLDIEALEQSLTGPTVDVGIFLGNGDGAFTTGNKYATKGIPASLVVADLDGDANPDIVLTNGQLLLGNGNGTFKFGKTLPIPSNTVSLVAADFNKDNKTDLALVTTTDVVGVFLGNGDGTLQAPTWYSGVYQCGAITTADVDGDGNLDLVLGLQTGGGFAPMPNVVGATGGLGVLMGNGDGTFRGALAYQTGASPGLNNYPYAIADINGDGIPDILTASSLLIGNGTGQFTVKLGSQFPGLSPSIVGSVIRVADLTNDKINDAVVTTIDTDGTPSTAHVFLGKSGGTFGAGTALSVPNILDVAIADFNGDGIPDLAVLSYTVGSGISVHVLLGTGKGTFAAPLAVSLPAGTSQSTGGRIFSADFNNDKNADLLLLDVGNYQNSENGGAYVFLGNGKGSFTLSDTITQVNNPFDAAIADFNKDGNLDLVISSTDFNESFSTPPLIFLGSGKGTFGTGKSLPTISSIPLHLFAADFNGDGNPDLVIGNCCGLAVTSVVFGKGNGTFEAEQIMQVAESPSQIAVADLNGDDRPDIVISSGNAPGMLVTLINEYGVVSDSDKP